MILVIHAQGKVHGVYEEAINLNDLGPVQISRASHVEPDETGQWWADLAPVGGPKLGPFSLRSQALAAEKDWLEGWLTNH